MNNLKPCPFCGGKLNFYRENYVNRFGKRIIKQYWMQIFGAIGCHPSAPTVGPRWTEVTTLNVERPVSYESVLRGPQHQPID